MPTRIQLHHSSASAWQAANPVLAEGEVGLETGTGRLKIGNGTTPWNNLEYAIEKAFTTLEKTKLAGIQAGATAAGVVGDEHARRTGNPHATTPAQIGAEPAGAVTAHAGGTNVHTIRGVTGLQAALDTKLSALSLQKDGDTPRQIKGINLTGAASIAGVSAGIVTVNFAGGGVEPQELTANGPVTSALCLVLGVATNVSLPAPATGLKYTTLKNTRAATVTAVGPINGYPQGYTLPAGESASFVRMSSGRWEVV